MASSPISGARDRTWQEEARSLRVGDDTDFRTSELESLPLPARLRDLISRRLEGLSEQAQQCVELSAVLGREVTWKF